MLLHQSSILYHHLTPGRHLLLSSCRRSRNAGRRSPSPQRRWMEKCTCQQHHIPYHHHSWLEKHRESSQTHRPPPDAPVKECSCSPSPPSRVKGTLSLFLHLDESRIPRTPKRVSMPLPTRFLPNPPSNEVQAKSPPNPLPCLSWCAALCRTCLWTMPPCAGWRSRRPRLHLVSTNEAEAGPEPPASPLLLVTLSERKMEEKRR